MKYLPAFVRVVLLAGLLSACVPAEKYENLKAQNDELEQTLETQKRMSTDADEVHLLRISDLERQLTEARQELEDQEKDLEELRNEYTDAQQKHRATSDELSKAVTNSLALIQEKNQLNATIIKLQGTIATLKDTVKDLQIQLAELKPVEPRPGPAELPPNPPP